MTEQGYGGFGFKGSGLLFLIILILIIFSGGFFGFGGYDNY